MVGLVKILTIPLIALAFFWVCFRLIHWLVVKKFPLNSLQLKRLDYLWLSLSAFGLFGLLADNRIFFSKIEIEKYDVWIERQSELVKISTSHLCLDFFQNEHSLKNLEDMQVERKSICHWVKNNYDIINSLLEERRSINIDELNIPFVQNSSLRNDISCFLDKIKRYNRYVNRRQAFYSATHFSGLERTIRIISPLLLILGLSIRFVKTSGEIRLQKIKPND